MYTDHNLAKFAKLYAAQHQFEDPSGSFLLPCFRRVFKRAIWRLFKPEYWGKANDCDDTGYPAKSAA